ncbi:MULTISPECIES: thioredoxin-like domain-containing protein [unclassified Sulfurimonas]|uniref:thioredoxin-like domain-containing protein n=1 Tax=unclassified Sulfurimonas TaxID=2623549 RepID=UPI0008BC4C8B|nr:MULTISPECIES: thioredoxin-like domain-containing protein [unclassified Sulfurimonas]MBS4068300.1 redoxin domain-containing protein [Sulfurimonas sp.]MDD3855118.1 thioredoxin fold domain-containing protein [Sulfurimonas sp.]OHE04803.1 MAG: thioredoxin [Sulfurimonas sp. RIFOXYB12_FULL_35_9]OHE11961.1 MAG: thioredoxin [Sulfurimonas sp. RIFOXYC2_FULL_36_7]
MREKIAKYAKELILFFIIMSIFANILSFCRSSDLNKDRLNLSSVTLLNNQSFTLPKNEPILIYFWGTWCPVCKMQSKDIETVSKKFNVLSIAVKSGSNIEIEEYLKSQNLSFRVFNDQYSSMAQKFRISIFPTIIIFDKDGNEIFSDVGYTTIFGLWLRMWWATL